MKLSAVYKSTKKADTYLYVKEKDKFEDVPKALLEHFGKPKFVMLIPISKRSHIANLPVNEFVHKVSEKGFYLQLPPKEEDLLSEHRKAMGLDAVEKYEPHQKLP